MTPLPLLAAVALRSATLACPALATDPPRLVIQRIAECDGWRWAPGVEVRGCFTAMAGGPAVITIDPRTPRAALAADVLHEAGHACAYATGRANWRDHSFVRAFVARVLRTERTVA